MCDWQVISLISYLEGKLAHLATCVCVCVLNYYSNIYIIKFQKDRIYSADISASQHTHKNGASKHEWVRGGTQHGGSVGWKLDTR